MQHGAGVPVDVHSGAERTKIKFQVDRKEKVWGGIQGEWTIVPLSEAHNVDACLIDIRPTIKEMLEKQHRIHPLIKFSLG